MNIEEKAKAYDKALELARGAINAGASGMLKEDLEYVFPELAESEDEKIRKSLIRYYREILHTYGSEELVVGFKVGKILAYLEKQGEKNRDDYSLEEAANIFLDALSKTPYNNKPVTDAQIITKELLKFMENASSYNPDALNEQKPIEEVDGDDYGIDGLWHAVRILENTLSKVEGYQSDDGILEHKAAITAVKKLQEQKPVEWSKEDERILDDIISHLESEHDIMPKCNTSQIRWLKSLRPQKLSNVERIGKNWKPSEEQMYALNKVIEILRSEELWNKTNPIMLSYESLIRDLVKLKSE